MSEELQNEAVVNETDPNTEDGLSIFYWKGQKRYMCPEPLDSGAPCQYDTHDKDQMTQHVRETHAGWRREATTRVSPILNERGQNIFVEEPPADVRGARFKIEE